MRAVLCLLLAAAGCGGSDAASVFEGPQGSADSSTNNSADTATAEDTTPLNDVDTVRPDTTSTDTASTDTAPPMCPKASTMPPLKCPDVCTGGCVEDACRILCNGVSSCGGRRLDCPPGMKCRVECSGVSSCGNLEVRCPDTGACDVQCIGTSACGNINVRCPTTAPCSINCAGVSSCGGGQVQCGNGACTAQCTGGRLAKVTCGASCLCSNKCTP